MSNIFLLLTGIIFYFYSDPKSLLFLLILSIINYFLVKFANDDVQWIDGKYLTVIKTGY